MRIVNLVPRSSVYIKHSLYDSETYNSSSISTHIYYSTKNRIRDYLLFNFKTSVRSFRLLVSALSSENILCMSFVRRSRRRTAFWFMDTTKAPEFESQRHGQGGSCSAISESKQTKRRRHSLTWSVTACGIFIIDNLPRNWLVRYGLGLVCWKRSERTGCS